ncbi:MAG TPA: hypothetical protein VF041_21115 [Gemmatimonadaceae bacterium]
MEQQHDEPNQDYPRGRGYGHDYMRGGEVFGGYGYSDRDEYGRPRGEIRGERRRSGEGSEDDDQRMADDGGERFPQDERAGGWEIPADLEDDAHRATPAESTPDGTPGEDGSAERRDALGDGAGAPVPKIEHTFGDTGGNLLHSRSYYVTQAQLQQRLNTPPGRVRGT